MSDPYAGYPNLTFQRPEPHVLQVVLDSPGLNAVDRDVHRQLADVWLTIDRDPDVRVALLTGAGRAFSAGGSFDLIDESHNASPAAVRAAIAVLDSAAVAPGGRRIAVLGDMLELGAQSARLHAELAAPLAAADIALVYTVGDDMARLHAALPERMRGAHCASAVEMAPVIAAALRPGDVVTVKGSLGIRMAVIVKHLLAGEPAPVASNATAR